MITVKGQTMTVAAALALLAELWDIPPEAPVQKTNEQETL